MSTPHLCRHDLGQIPSDWAATVSALSLAPQSVHTPNIFSLPNNESFTYLDFP